MLLDRSPLEPGTKVDTDVVLVSRSETPVEHVEVTLTADVVASVPSGKTFATERIEAAPAQRFRWSPGTLAKGEHRQRVRFALAADTPPSYRAARGWCRVQYVVEVHVVIPYWIDRRVSFALPVSAPARELGRGAPAIVATHPRGQVAHELYIEAALDTTELVPGEELRGDVTFANVGARRIRRIEIGFVATEAIRAPGRATNTVARYVATLGSGAPPEGETIPFRIKLPAEAWPSFDARIFALAWHFEVRADIVLGTDVVLRVPIEIARPLPGAPLPERMHRALPVGRQRLARLWSIVAQRAGVSYDEESGAMMAARGPVTMTIAREIFEGTLGIVAHFHYPHLGLDLKLDERTMIDVFARKRWDAPPWLRRYTVQGREAAQLDAFFDEAIGQYLARATRAEMDDDDAHVHVAGAASSASALETVARDALAFLDVLAAALARIPVPENARAIEAAWRDFAASTSGRFEPGRVFVHDASFGGFRFEAGIVWQPDDHEPLGTVLRVPIEPPLARAPDPEDPALSAVAREMLKTLSATPGFHADENEMGVFTHGVTADPKTLEPTLEAMVAVLRALRGSVAAGPFR